MVECSEFKLKKSFRNLFPEYAKALDSAKTYEEFDYLHKKFILEQKNILMEKMIAANIDVSKMSLEESDQTACIPLSQDTYKLLINANGEEIKNQLHVLIDGLERLKGMEDNDPGIVTAQILLSGALGIGLLSTSTVICKLVSGAVEAVAAFAGVTASTVGVVCAIASVVIVAILIPIIYFMQKPASCIVLLINELDKDLTFLNDHNEHGKPVLMTTPIKRGVSIPGIATYPVAGLIATEKRSQALIGTQYGFVMKYGDTNTNLTFGVECPLSSIYSDNNCYCAFNETAESAAKNTSKENKQEYSVSKDNIKLSIKCNSGTGSIAYYVARAYFEK